jgi:hypothetical protein
VAPVEGPQLLVQWIATRVSMIGGRGIASGSCKWRDPVQQGVKGCSSGVTELCVPLVWNLVEFFANSAIIDDDEEVN